MSDEQKPGVFTRLYLWMMAASRRPQAPLWLGLFSAAESSVFPIPPDVMLAPMTLARPERWFWLATLTMAASVAGGLLGYWIGHALIDLALPAIERWGYAETYARTVHWVEEYGFWALVIKGLTPVPYKLFTIAAGAASMPLHEFVLASILSRSIRFYAVAGLVRAVGPRIEPHLVRYMDRIGWGIVALIVLLIAWYALK